MDQLKDVLEWLWAILSVPIGHLYFRQLKMEDQSQNSSDTLHQRVNDTNKMLSDHRLSVSKLHPTKSEFEASLSRLESRVEKGFEQISLDAQRRDDRMMQALDRIDAKLDRKVDKE